MELSIGNYALAINLSFQEVVMLLVLIVMVLAAFEYMKKLRKERTINLGNYKTLKEVQDRGTVASPVVPAVKIIMVTLLFLVATGSVRVVTVQPVSNTDFVFAVDDSQSMMTPDYPPNRLEFTKQRLKKWTNRLPDNTEVSIIGMGGGATPVENIESLETSPGKTGRAIGQALKIGSNILKDSENGIIVLVTGGGNTKGLNISTALKKVKEHNITVHVIGISPTDETVRLYRNLSQSLEEAGFNSTVDPPTLPRNQLKKIAESTGGNYYLISEEGVMEEGLEEIVLKKEAVPLDSSPYILGVITLLIISEMLVYSRYGAI